MSPRPSKVEKSEESVPKSALIIRKPTCTDDASNAAGSGLSSPPTTLDQDEYARKRIANPHGSTRVRIVADPVKKERHCTKCGELYISRNPEHCEDCWWEHVAFDDPVRSGNAKEPDKVYRTVGLDHIQWMLNS